MLPLLLSLFRGQKISLIIVLALTCFGCSSLSSTQTTSEKTANNSQQKSEREYKKDLDNTVVSSSNSPQKLPITAKTQISQEVINLEVAKTPRQQALGLMFRKSLPDNRGMLFTFDRPQVAQFWMKNVEIPLDMIFLYKGEVKAIAANVPPCFDDPCPIYGPDGLVDEVIELRGGRAEELNLKVGDRLLIEFLNITQ
ncbi:MAG: DUF192 domain-containing protein [Xenococcaceae cyanobacterium]